MRLVRRLLLILGCWMAMHVAGCGGAVPAQRPAVELPLVTAEGDPLRLSLLRGRPVLLFFFATYDGSCQLALTPLVETLPDYEPLALVGVALQPDAGSLLSMFGASLGLDFPLAYDPGGHLMGGGTALGPVKAIPLYVLLNGQGQEIARHQGVLLGDQLTEFLDQSR